MTIYHIVLFKFKSLVPLEEVQAVSSPSHQETKPRSLWTLEGSTRATLRLI